MKNNENKSQWHDGWFYYHLISPNLKNLYDKIARNIPEGSSVIDVACGIGYIGFTFHGRFSKYTGIDLSSKSIEVAKYISNKRKLKNTEYLHLNALKLTEKIAHKYDYSVISLALHEMPESIRLKIIENMAEISKYQIIADYSHPLPNNLYTGVVYLSEFFAGIEHFRNFRNYQRNGGLASLIDRSNLSIIDEQKSFMNNLTILKTKGRD